MIDPPSHLHNRPDDRTSLCGIKKPLPIMCAFAVPLHQANYDLVACADCVAALPDAVWLPSHLTADQLALIADWFDRVKGESDDDRA